MNMETQKGTDRKPARKAALMPFMAGALAMALFFHVLGVMRPDAPPPQVGAVEVRAADVPKASIPLIEKPDPLMVIIEAREWGDFDWKTELNTPYVDCGLPEDVQDYLYIMCIDLGVDYAMALGWIQQESMFNPSEVSPTNDWGLTQINACNHEWLKKELGITDFLDPYQSIRAGLFVLRRLYDKYDTANCALMAYNFGEGGAKRLWDTGVWESDYTRNIMRNAAAWRDAIEESRQSAILVGTQKNLE